MESPTDKLKTLLDTGKITVQQYEEMLKNLPRPELCQPQISPSELDKFFISFMCTIPWQIRVCATTFIVLAVSVLFLPPYGFGSVVAILLCLGIGIGLLKKIAWVYIIALLVSIGSIIFFIEFDVPIGMGIGIVYTLLLASAWRFYFR